MDFFLGVFVGGLTVGGIMFAKVMAMKAEANATPNRYLSGWRPHEADDDGHISEAAAEPNLYLTRKDRERARRFVIESGEGL